MWGWAIHHTEIAFEESIRRLSHVQSLSLPSVFTVGPVESVAQDVDTRSLGNPSYRSVRISTDWMSDMAFRYVVILLSCEMVLCRVGFCTMIIRAYM
jgi:hypothetical protein